MIKSTKNNRRAISVDFEMQNANLILLLIHIIIVFKRKAKSVIFNNSITCGYIEMQDFTNKND